MKDSMENYQAFLQELNKMSEVFSDEMSEFRQEAYWQIFGEHVTLEEWEEACLQAMSRETFHKVPVPAVMWGYIKQQRPRRAHL